MLRLENTIRKIIDNFVSALVAPNWYRVFSLQNDHFSWKLELECKRLLLIVEWNIILERKKRRKYRWRFSFHSHLYRLITGTLYASIDIHPYCAHGYILCGFAHLNGSIGADSSKIAAASKHSAASNVDALGSSLWVSPRLYQAEGFVLSSRSASLRRLLMTGSDSVPSCLRILAVDIKLATWVGSTFNASLNDFRASW